MSFPRNRGVAYSCKTVVLWLLWLLMLSIDVAFCEDYARNHCPVECGCLGNAVECSGLQLIEAPSGLPPWTEKLGMTNNNIANLKHNSLLHLPKLKQLDLSVNKLGDDFILTLSNETQLRELKVSHNRLSSVPDKLTLHTLTHLTLSHNAITKINGTALLNFPKLQHLDLSFNKIRVLAHSSFLVPNQLTTLNLNVNNISSIVAGAFENLTRLEELHLNKNQLTHLKDVLLGLEKLRVLEINRNELKQIQYLNFKDLVNLRDLRLKRNKIDTLDPGAFLQLKNLTHLQLDFNQMTKVTKAGHFGLERLQKLSLSHNRISIIEHQAWELCKEIGELDLSHNKLTTIDRRSLEYLTKLEKLRLDHNIIAHISGEAFSNVPNLKILDINYNKIDYTVEDINEIFVPLGRLLQLGLAHNMIKSVNKNVFNGLSQLLKLDLTGNNITSIEENAFLPMPKLRELKMNTSSLVCDCDLQWLGEWLQNRNYNAKVRCGYPHWLRGMSVINLHQANFTCDNYPKPQIIEEPASQLSIKGDNVTLVCKASSTSDAPLYFTWKHNNVVIKESDIQIDNTSVSRNVTTASSKLHLYNVTHANAGRYQCMVTNNYGTTYSAKAKISVLIYPSFSKIPHDIRVIAGSTASLQCSAEGEPTPQIAWQKDGGNDFPAARERRMHKMPTDDVLFIIDVKTADSGTYSCTAQNLAGLIVANATLTILEPPSFVKPMEDKEVMAGGSVVLECMASGSPRPKLTWRKDGEPLEATKRHFFTAENQLLIIVHTVVSDAGDYECEMSNSLGSVSDSLELTVNPATNSLINEDDILGMIIMTVVCCAVGTSIVWVVIIYRTRQRLNVGHITSKQASAMTATATVVAVPDTQTHLYLDTSSQHSKDSGTGDSTNPSNDQLQLCIPEEIVTCAVSNDDDGTAINGEDPLLRYTNHERQIPDKDDGMAD